MNFDLEFGNCFLIKRNEKHSLVVDKDYVKDRSKVKVGMTIEINQVFGTYKIESVYYDSIYGLYVLGLEE